MGAAIRGHHVLALEASFVADCTGLRQGDAILLVHRTENRGVGGDDLGGGVACLHGWAGR